jgi:predicted RNA-binding Zn ribbon-like protein
MQVTVFKFVGGRVCLDFVNTVGGRARGTVIRDKLREYPDLLAWSEAAGLMTAPQIRALARAASVKRRSAKAVLSRAIALREALFLLFQGRPNDTALAVLNRELAIARHHEHLARAHGAFVWRWDDSPVLDRMLWPVARSAAELLASSDLEKVRECSGPDCGWLFLDTSRNGARRWCDMRDCGNRAKVTRFRDRRRTSYAGT